MAEYGTMRVKSGLAEMLKGGVIMDVVNAEQAKVAEASGAVAVMALERVPADIRRDGGVARMSDPEMIREIQESVSIPVMAKCRIGHFAEAQILEALEIDYIDESEVLTPADMGHRDARGRCALHAARRRRRLRRVRHLQVRRSRAARKGDRRGDDALQRRCDSRACLRGPRRADGRHLDADARSERAARDARLVRR